MRASPLVLLGLVAGGLALIAVPLARLTGAAPSLSGGARAVAVSGEVGEGERVPMVVRIRFAHAPVSVVLKQGERVLADFGVPEDAMSGQMDRAAAVRLVEGEFLDVGVEARWPAGTPSTALGVEVEPDGWETRRQTLWADDGELDALATFSWE